MRRIALLIAAALVLPLAGCSHPNADQVACQRWSDANAELHTAVNTPGGDRDGALADLKSALAYGIDSGGSEVSAAFRRIMDTLGDGDMQARLALSNGFGVCGNVKSGALS